MNKQDQQILCQAFGLSLAAALIEAARSDVAPSTSLGNRLARAAETTERAIEFFPRVHEHFDAQLLASEFIDLLQIRINALIANGGWRRGEKDLDRFFQNMLERLNDPKNVIKGDYRQMSFIDLKNKMDEEKAELVAELWKADNGMMDPSALIREAADRAVVAMFCAVKAEEI